MTKRPAISVLIPTYRYARYLAAAIESVLSQDFGDFELIISDDASGDGTAAILALYAAQDPRINAVVQPTNIGMVGNWNWCLRQARGKYVKYLFGDDLLVSTSALRRHYEALEANPHAIMSTSARQLIDDRGRITGRWDNLKRDGCFAGMALGKRCLLEMKNLIGEPTAVMFRRTETALPFDSSFRQIVDLDMWLALLRKGDLCYISEPLCAFRRHPAQATEANKKLKIGYSEHALLLVKHIGSFVEANAWLSREERRQIFVVLYCARKASGRIEGADSVVSFLEPLLSPYEILRYSFEYRLKRPYINLRRSLSRRLLGRRIEWSFATGWQHAEFIF